MRILFLTSQVPYPPISGGPLRVYGLLDGLHTAGYTPDLLTFVDRSSPDPAQTPLAKLCGKITMVPTPRRSGRERLRDLLRSPQPDLARRFYSPTFAETLRAQLAAYPYKLVHLQSLEMATYLPLVREAAPQAKIIYDAYNAEYDLQRLIYKVDRRNLMRWLAALYSFLQWRRLYQFESEVCRAADRVIAVSEADAEALRKLAPNTPLTLVPNAIYAAEYTQNRQPLALGSAALLFTGTMNYRPNVDAMLWFVRHVLDRVRQAVPEARLFIVGNKPHSRLDSIRRRKDVEITGYVQDVTPFLHSAAVYVAPLRMGSGTRLKLLQAMAAGCAIVSTPIGALGLAVENGREMLLAEDPITFAQAVIGLLRDPAKRAALGQAAQNMAQTRYDWSVIVPCLLKLYTEMGFEPSRSG